MVSHPSVYASAGSGVRCLVLSAAIIVAVTIAATLLIPVPAVAASANSVDVYVCHVATGRYLDADGANGNSGHYNVSTSLNPTGDDEWRMTQVDHQLFVFRNREKLRFLDADGADKLWNVDGSKTIRADDKWRIEPSPDGTVALFNPYRGQYLHALGGQANWNVNTVPHKTAATAWMIVPLGRSCHVGMVEPLVVELNVSPPSSDLLRAPVVAASRVDRELGGDHITSYALSVDQIGPDATLSGTVVIRTRPFNFIAAIDISQSTVDGRPGCGGDEDADGRAGTVVDCELMATRRVIDRIATEAKNDAKVGIVGFSASAAAADVSPESGVQLLTAVDADVDQSGRSDIDEVVSGLRARNFSGPPSVERFTPVQLLHGTNFRDAVDKVCRVAAHEPDTPSVVAFFSDGRSLVGGGVDDLLPCGEATTFHTIAVGDGASCETGEPSLQHIANLTGGSCTEIVDLSQLPDRVPELIVPETVSLSLTIDGTLTIDLADSVDLALPAAGDFSFHKSLTQYRSIADAFATADKICVTAVVAEGGRRSAIVTCSPVERADTTLGFSWEPTLFPGPAPTLSDPAIQSPTFSPGMAGVYVFEVTMTDTLRRVWRDTVEVVVEDRFELPGPIGRAF